MGGAFYRCRCDKVGGLISSLAYTYIQRRGLDKQIVLCSGVGPTWDGVAMGWVLNRCPPVVTERWAAEESDNFGLLFTYLFIFICLLGDLSAQVLHGSCIYIILNIIIYFI